MISRNNENQGSDNELNCASRSSGITRASFCGGASIHEYSKASNCKLLLSAEEEDVRNVIENGGAAGFVYPPPEGYLDDARQVRIAFDADAVIFSDEAERIYQEMEWTNFGRAKRAKLKLHYAGSI